MNIINELKEGRALIADPLNWTTGTRARNSKGTSVSPFSPEAVCWCSTGAIEKVTVKEGKNLDAYHEARDALRNEIWLPVWAFNDKCTHAQVLELWDTVIEKREQMLKNTFMYKVKALFSRLRFGVNW